MRNLILFLLITIVTLPGLAQKEEFNLAGITYSLNPKVGLENPINDQLQDVNMNISELRAFVLLPFRFNEETTTLLAGVDYTYLGGPLDNLPGERKVEANLHALRFTAGINQKFGEKWAIRALLMPTIASDFSGDLRSEAFTLQASTVIKRITASGFRFGLGAAYTNGFGEPKTVPLAELSYKGENFDFVVIAPVQAAFRYHLNKALVGFRVDLLGNEYALSIDDEINNLPKIESVKFSRYNIGPTVALNLSDNIRLQLSGGISVKRKLTATDVENVTHDYGLKNGAFLKAGFFFGDFGKE